MRAYSSVSRVSVPFRHPYNMGDHGAASNEVPSPGHGWHSKSWLSLSQLHTTRKPDELVSNIALHLQDWVCR